MKRLGWVAAVAVVLCFAPDSPSGRQGRADDSERASVVKEAMLGIYVHGVTEELAARLLLTRDDVPILASLLREPSFPRRDNVAAFLAMLDDGGATTDILSFMAEPPADVDVPEELRALIVAPQALGRIAARGDGRALDALLEITRDGGEGGRFLSGARRSRAVGRADDVLESALRGLALSGSSEGRRRLEDLARGLVRPRARGRDLAAAARRELDYFDELRSPQRRGARASAGAALDGGPSSFMAATAPPVPGNVLDPSGATNAAFLTYANHIAVSNKMNDTRLDPVLREAELRAGREDFPADTMCCLTIDRQGTAQDLNGAGLDVIDNGTELNAVLNDGISRVKVVNAINWCTTAGTNILGCAWIGAHGMSLVRMTSLQDEAVLWLHEYGHNTGLFHAGTSEYVMYGFLTTGANGLSEPECAAYHNPADGSSPPVTGTCADSDGDKIHDLADNCRFLVNPAQTDTDSDGQGDPCDGDADSDGVADVSDCSPLDLNAWAIPGQATDLNLTHTTATVLAWSPPAVPGGTATGLRYDVLRATGPASFSPSPLCVETDSGPDTVATTSLPPATIWSGEGAGVNFRFGASISNAGNINNDAYDDFIVGSPGFNNGSDLEGRVEVRFGSAGGPGGSLWTYDPDWDFAGLGASVGGGGDFDNDGFDDIIVGAPTFEDSSFTGGAVFAFYGSSSGLPSSPDWSVGGVATGISFGKAVAVVGDIDNDNFDDVIVGAPLLTVSFSSEGGVFLYRGSASGLSETPSAWAPTGGAASVQFGASVAGAGDVNNDGYADVIVGAPFGASGQSTEGLAYVYLGSASGLEASPQVLQVNQIAANFGWSVASAGDVNKDNYDDVIVGAKEYDVDQTNEGAAFIFYGSPTGIDPTIGPPLHGDRQNADYGVSVSSAGDYNGDGYDDIVVGAAQTNNGLTRAGRVYLYLGSPLGPVHFQTIEGDQVDAELGGAVARAGDTNGDGLSDFATAAVLYDNGQLNEGLAKVNKGVPGPDPPVGTIHFFLVRAQNVCGLGPAGFSSSGSSIVASNCTLE